MECRSQRKQSNNKNNIKKEMKNEINLKNVLFMAVVVEGGYNINVEDIPNTTKEWKEVRWLVKAVQSAFDEFQDKKEDYSSFIEFIFIHSVPLWENQ